VTDPNPLFRISVYDKNRAYLFPIGNPTALEATVRFNDVGTLSMTVPLTHERVTALMEDGVRLRVLYRGEHLISGPITADELDTDGKKGTYRITVEDDFRVLKDILGWQAPANTIDNQSTAEYRKYTGNAEGIVKVAVTENGVNRLGISGLTVATNLSRGTSVPGGLSYRMHPLADLMFPAVETAGLGVTVRQDAATPNANLVLDVFTPTTFDKPLSIRGGTLKQVTMTRTRPTASRVVIGGSGEAKERSFRVVTDTARETTYGMKAERFVDDRQSGSDYTSALKDTSDAKFELDFETDNKNKAAKELTAAQNAKAHADLMLQLAQDGGNATRISSAQSVVNARAADVTAATTANTAAINSYNTALSAYNARKAISDAALAAYQAGMDDTGTKALTEAGPTNGVSITLAGSGIFQYGPGGFHVGDKVPIRITDTITVTEVIRECTLKWVSPTHASVDPSVGELTNRPERKTANLFKALARGLRNQETR
jgi:hypothetical protein